jgi:hypothetical protein
MELLEMVGWVALGFIPTLGGLSFISRKLSAIKRVHEVSLWADRGGAKTN